MEALVDLPSAATESVHHITTLLNTTNEAIIVFKALACPYDHWDHLLIYFMESKLAPATRLDCEKERNEDNAFAIFADIKKFLESRIPSLDSADLIACVHQPER